MMDINIHVEERKLNDTGILTSPPRPDRVDKGPPPNWLMPGKMRNDWGSTWLKVATPKWNQAQGPSSGPDVGQDLKLVLGDKVDMYPHPN